MNNDHPLSMEFLRLYPFEAARVLEEIAADDVAALFNDLALELIAPVLAAMLPDRAALSLKAMDPTLAAKSLSEISPSQAARIYRLLTPEVQQVLAKLMSAKTLRRIRHFINYAAISAGDLMEPNVPMLPVDVTVAEAIRRIERLDQAVACEIYVVDDAHRLLGQLELGRLLISNHHAKVKDVMNRRPQPLAVHATAEALLSHPGWQRRRCLPVVDRDNTLVGILDFTRVQEVNDNRERTYRDTSGGLVSVVGLYWLTIIQLLDSLFSMAGAGKGEKR